MFNAINQWTILENESKRPDVVVFVNGLPLVVVELKSCMREDTDFSDGYRQIKNYMQEIPCLFRYNAFSVISDLVNSKVGTITAGFDRFVDWKTVDGSYEETQYARYDVLFNGMLEPNRFLDILKHFILFSQNTPEDIKILAGYHQYFAVRKAVESTIRASGLTYEAPLPFTDLLVAEPATLYSINNDKQRKTGDRKGGVFWHTQGSGKSLSMVFYASLLRQVLDSPTIVVITDRNDLDDQLYTQFTDCKDFLRQTAIQAESREHLRELLAGRQANGIFSPRCKNLRNLPNRSASGAISSLWRTKRTAVNMALRSA
jgi:type I restriction enzyme R subunit